MHSVSGSFSTVRQVEVGDYVNKLTSDTAESTSWSEPVVEYHLLQTESLKSLYTDDKTSCMAFTSKRLLLGTYLGYVYVLDNCGKEVCHFTAHRGYRVNDLSIDDVGSFVATVGDDGVVAVHSLETVNDPDFWYCKYSFPLLAVAIQPEYSPQSVDTKGVCIGCQDGKFLLNRRGVFSSSNVVLHSGEGPVIAIKWQGNMLAWANDLGVKIIDMKTLQKISFIPKHVSAPTAPMRSNLPSLNASHISVRNSPSEQTGTVVEDRNYFSANSQSPSSLQANNSSKGQPMHQSNFLNNSNNTTYPTCLCWASPNVLFIGWGHSIKIIAIKTRSDGNVESWKTGMKSSGKNPNSSVLQRLNSKGPVIKFTEILYCLYLDSEICGVVPFNAAAESPGNFLSVLTRFCEKISGTEWFSSRPLHQIFKWDGTLQSEELLDIHDRVSQDLRFSPFQLVYRDFTMPTYILTPQGIVQARRRGLQDHAFWLYEHEKYEEAIHASKKGSKELLHTIGISCIKSLLKKGEYARAAQFAWETCIVPADWEFFSDQFDAVGALPVFAEFMLLPLSLHISCENEKTKNTTETSTSDSSGSNDLEQENNDIIYPRPSSLFFLSSFSDGVSPPPLDPAHTNSTMLHVTSTVLETTVYPTTSFYSSILFRLCNISIVALLKFLRSRPCYRSDVTRLIEHLRSLLTESDTHKSLQVSLAATSKVDPRSTLSKSIISEQKTDAMTDAPSMSSSSVSKTTFSVLEEGSVNVPSPKNAANLSKDIVPILHCLAYMYEIIGEYVNALEMLLRLQSKYAFKLLTTLHKTDAAVKEFAITHAMRLFNLDWESALKLFVGNKNEDSNTAFPVNQVAASLMENSDLLHQYLKALFFKDPSHTRDFHKLQVTLFAQHDPQLLLEFLKGAYGSYDIEEVLKLCRNPMDYISESRGETNKTQTPIKFKLKSAQSMIVSPTKEKSESLPNNDNFAARASPLKDQVMPSTIVPRTPLLPSFLYAQAFLLNKMGLMRDAMQIFLFKLQDIPGAVQFACENNDADLWQFLMQYLLQHPHLLVQVLSYLDTHAQYNVTSMEIVNTSFSTSRIASNFNLPFAPIELLRRLPSGDFHKIPRIEKKMSKIMVEFESQVEFARLCVATCKVDIACFRNELLYRRKRGQTMRSVFLLRGIDLPSVSAPPHAIATVDKPVIPSVTMASEQISEIVSPDDHTHTSGLPDNIHFSTSSVPDLSASPFVDADSTNAIVSSTLPVDSLSDRPSFQPTSSESSLLPSVSTGKTSQAFLPVYLREANYVSVTSLVSSPTATDTTSTSFSRNLLTGDTSSRFRFTNTRHGYPQKAPAHTRSSTLKTSNPFPAIFANPTQQTSPAEELPSVSHDTEATSELNPAQGTYITAEINSRRLPAGTVKVMVGNFAASNQCCCLCRRSLFTSFSPSNVPILSQGLNKLVQGDQKDHISTVSNQKNLKENKVPALEQNFWRATSLSRSENLLESGRSASSKFRFYQDDVETGFLNLQSQYSLNILDDTSSVEHKVDTGTADNFDQEEALVVFWCGHYAHLSCQIQRQNLLLQFFDENASKKSIARFTTGQPLSIHKGSVCSDFSCFVCQCTPYSCWVNSNGCLPSWDPARPLAFFNSYR